MQDEEITYVLNLLAKVSPSAGRPSLEQAVTVLKACLTRAYECPACDGTGEVTLQGQCKGDCQHDGIPRNYCLCDWHTDCQACFATGWQGLKAEELCSPYRQAAKEWQEREQAKLADNFPW